MQLKHLQLPKIKLSFSQRMVYAAAVSSFIIIIGIGSFFYFNSVSTDSKAVSPTIVALFTATLNTTGTQVEVYWVTSSEYNCDYFVIQRSDDAINYSQLAEVQASGTSTAQNTYDCMDNNPISGISYYRLKYIDIGGEYHYGAIQEINNEYVQPDNDINIYPSPASSYCYVQLTTTKIKSAEIFVVDLTGKIVKNLNSEMNDGINKIKIDINDLPNGIYFVSMDDGSGNVISQKMIKTQ